MIVSNYPTMLKPKPTAATKATPAERDVEDAILEALADAQSKGLEEVRAEFVSRGPSMPLDSLETVEIMVGLEERFGVRFPETPETCAAFQSVETLVRLVRELAAAAI